MLAAQLDALLIKLSAPVTADEQAHGWTTEAKAGMAEYARDAKIRFAREALVRDFSLVRGLDAWGVGGGQLYDEIMDFNRQLPSP